MDVDLRTLEREANQGNPYAIKKLVYTQLRAGQPLYRNFYLRRRIYQNNDIYQNAPGAYEMLGFPLQVHFSGRFIPYTMDEELFFERFQVNDSEAELVLARPLCAEFPEDPNEIPQEFQHLLAETPQNFLGHQGYDEWINDRFEDGYHIITDVIPLENLTIKNLLLPPVYDERHIPEHEDPPEYPEKTILWAIKEPGEELKIFHAKTDSNFIERALGTDQFTSLELPWTGKTLRMFVRELPKGRPNFILKIPSNVHPSARERVLEMIEQGKADPGILNFMQDRYEVMYGPAVFVNISVPEFESIDWSYLPWPWNVIAKENPDREWPASTEFNNLDEGDAELIEDLILPINIQLPEPATHFTKEDSGAIIYEVEPCDKCKSPTMAPNSVHIFATRKELLNAGLIELGKLPPELGWSEELEAAVCESCYSDSQDD